MIWRLNIPRLAFWYIALAAFCVGSTFMLWTEHVWTLTQQHYLWPYLWCSRPGADPSSQVSVRWFNKTAPGKSPEIALKDDVISSAANQRSLVLSAAARQAGWTALELGPKEHYSAATLRPFLEAQFFDGNSVWHVLSTPLLCGLACFCFVLLGLMWLKEKWRSARWELEQTFWFNPMLFMFRKWAVATEELCTFLLALAVHRARNVPAEDGPISSPIVPPAKPVQPSFSPFGVTDQTQKSTFAWSKKDEIE